MKKRILLVVGGGIAAYKCLELVRRARDSGFDVRCVMTEAATRFVTPLSFASLSADTVYTDLFSLTEEDDIGHIRLSREADLVVVAPATADLLAKLSAGLANDLASAVLLATNKPVLVAPAMNPAMWAHPATRRNVAQLKADGVSVIGPNRGEMAEQGEAGEGRMAEPLEILARIEAVLGSARIGALAGHRMIVTSGPTHEPIDPVRYLANRSSGKQGHAIAAAAATAGADVTLVSGPVSIPDPAGVHTIRVETARQMLAAVEEALPVEIAICAAAVADWRPNAEGGQKMKKDGKAAPGLNLVENLDILRTLAQHHTLRPRLVVGFAAETENVVEHAQAKLARKGCDLIVANDVSHDSGVMGGDRNRVHLVGAGVVESWDEMDKPEVATRLIGRIAEMLGAKLPGAKLPGAKSTGKA